MTAAQLLGAYFAGLVLSAISSLLAAATGSENR